MRFGGDSLDLKVENSCLLGSLHGFCLGRWFVCALGSSVGPLFLCAFGVRDNKPPIACDVAQLLGPLGCRAPLSRDFWLGPSGLSLQDLEV